MAKEWEFTLFEKEEYTAAKTKATVKVEKSVLKMRHENFSDASLQTVRKDLKKLVRKHSQKLDDDLENYFKTGKIEDDASEDEDAATKKGGAADAASLSKGIADALDNCEARQKVIREKYDLAHDWTDKYPPNTPAEAKKNDEKKSKPAEAKKKGLLQRMNASRKEQHYKKTIHARKLEAAMKDLNTSWVFLDNLMKKPRETQKAGNLPNTVDKRITAIDKFLKDYKKMILDLRPRYDKWIKNLAQYGPKSGKIEI